MRAEEKFEFLLNHLHDDGPRSGFKITLYSVGDATVFPIHNSDGNIINNVIYYLICNHNNKSYARAVEFSPNISSRGFVNLYLEQLDKFIQQLITRTAREVNMDGGELGRGDNEN